MKYTKMTLKRLEKKSEDLCNRLEDTSLHLKKLKDQKSNIEHEIQKLNTRTSSLAKATLADFQKDRSKTLKEIDKYQDIERSLISEINSNYNEYLNAQASVLASDFFVYIETNLKDLAKEIIIYFHIARKKVYNTSFISPECNSIVRLPTGTIYINHNDAPVVHVVSSNYFCFVAGGVHQADFIVSYDRQEKSLFERYVHDVISHFYEILKNEFPYSDSFRFSYEYDGCYLHFQLDLV